MYSTPCGQLVLLGKGAHGRVSPCLISQLTVIHAIIEAPVLSPVSIVAIAMCIRWQCHPLASGSPGPQACTSQPRQRLLQEPSQGLPQVYKAKMGATDVAVKQLARATTGSLGPDTLDAFKTEIAILIRMRHPNIVLAYGYYQEEVGSLVSTPMLQCVAANGHGAATGHGRQHGPCEVAGCMEPCSGVCRWGRPQKCLA